MVRSIPAYRTSHLHHTVPPTWPRRPPLRRSRALAAPLARSAGVTLAPALVTITGLASAPESRRSRRRGRWLAWVTGEQVEGQCKGYCWDGHLGGQVEAGLSLVGPPVHTGRLLPGQGGGRGAPT